VPSYDFYCNHSDRRTIANKKVKGASQPKGKRRNKAPSKARAQKRTPVSQPRFALSHCASLYAQAISEPFNVSDGACIPTSNSLVKPSQKVRAHARFIAAVGRNIGFALFSPCLANDKKTVHFTNSSFTGTTMEFTLGSTGGMEGANLSTLPYSLTSFTSGNIFSGSTVQGRIVSYGVRWRYIGTELNKGGRVYCLTHPDHDNLYAADFATLGAYKECITLPVSRSWQETSVFSQSATETNYPETQYALNNNTTTTVSADALEDLLAVYPLSQMQFLSTGYIAANSGSNSSVVGGAPLAIIFDGVEGNTFEFEIVAHIEYIGRVAQPFVTKSHADAVGFNTVQAAASSINVKRGSRSGLTHAKAFASGMGDSIASQSGMTMKRAGGVAGEIAYGYLKAKARDGRQYNSGSLIRDI
jgi:hypothetical protein